MKDLPLLATAVALLVLTGCQSIGLKQNPLPLATEGATSYTIVQPEWPSPPQAFAAEELATFLGRVTGAEFVIATEGEQPANAPAIYVGWTDFARSQGIDSPSLGMEEWVIRTVGDDLILTGGQPRGTLYAVYEFLQEQVGCYWLDAHSEVIPSRPSLVIQPLDIQDEPHFWQRQVHSPTGTPDDKWLFMIRNKNFRYGMRGRAKGSFFPDNTFWPVVSQQTSIHSFTDFVNGKDWFETHPEYFSLVNGERVPAYSGSGPGQLCLTHPDVLRLSIQRLREMIEEDRAAAPEGVPPPRLYYFTQNDIYHAHCGCDDCQAIAQREGSEAGPLVHFVNQMAEAIEEDYPDIIVGTIAYNLTSIPPKTIRPRKNVLIGWCDVYSKVDGIKRLAHPHNVENYSEITRWGEISPTLGIGDDYWTALSYYKYFPTPFAMIDCVAADLKLFADQGAVTFFAESGDYVAASQQFIPLKFWLAYQLLVDPQADADALVQIFMDGYFGEASQPIHDYLTYQRQRIDAEAQFKYLRNEPHNLAYLDLAFFETSQRLFDEAEARVPADSMEAKRIHVERFTLDGALLFLWPWLERKLPSGAAMPFDREALIERYARGWKALTSSRYSAIYTHYKNSLNTDGKLLDRMLHLFRNPQIPEQFQELPKADIADFNWLTFSQIRPRQMFVPDEDAVGHMTATFTERSRIQRAEKGGNVADVAADEQFRRPLTFGVTGGTTITLEPDDVPQHENYQLHSIGRIRVKPDTMVWALEGKRLGVNVDRLYNPDSDDPTANDWNAYISLKVQGPAYVEGSTKEDGVWMDRVLLVKPQPGEPISEAYRQQLEQERQRSAQRKKLTAPHIPAADGQPEQVDWSRASAPTAWWVIGGDRSDQDVTARFTHDGEWLYVRLSEQMDTSKLNIDPQIWRGDVFELLVAPQRGRQPYRQLAVNPEGTFTTRAYGEPAWESGAIVTSQVEPDHWTLLVALPLENLVANGAEPGQTLHLNLLRGGQEGLVWTPIWNDKFHTLEHFGQLTLAPAE